MFHLVIWNYEPKKKLKHLNIHSKVHTILHLR